MLLIDHKILNLFMLQPGCNQLHSQFYIFKYIRKHKHESTQQTYDT